MDIPRVSVGQFVASCRLDASDEQHLREALCKSGIDPLCRSRVKVWMASNRRGANQEWKKFRRWTKTIERIKERLTELEPSVPRNRLEPTRCEVFMSVVHVFAFAIWVLSHFALLLGVPVLMAKYADDGLVGSTSEILLYAWTGTFVFLLIPYSYFWAWPRIISLLIRPQRDQIRRYRWKRQPAVSEEVSTQSKDLMYLLSLYLTGVSFEVHRLSATNEDESRANVVVAIWKRKRIPIAVF